MSDSLAVFAAGNKNHTKRIDLQQFCYQKRDPFNTSSSNNNNNESDNKNTTSNTHSSDSKSKACDMTSRTLKQERIGKRQPQLQPLTLLSVFCSLPTLFATVLLSFVLFVSVIVILFIYYSLFSCQLFLLFKFFVLFLSIGNYNISVHFLSNLSRV